MSQICKKEQQLMKRLLYKELCLNGVQASMLMITVNLLLSARKCYYVTMPYRLYMSLNSQGMT